MAKRERRLLEAATVEWEREWDGIGEEGRGWTGGIDGSLSDRDSLAGLEFLRKTKVEPPRRRGGGWERSYGWGCCCGLETKRKKGVFEEKTLTLLGLTAPHLNGSCAMHMTPSLSVSFFKWQVFRSISSKPVWRKSLSFIVILKKKKKKLCRLTHCITKLLGN